MPSISATYYTFHGCINIAPGLVQGGGVLEHWSATENMTGAVEHSEKKGWCARVLELRKTSWSTGKVRKIRWSFDLKLLGALER